jgi:hypothetical protein
VLQEAEVDILAFHGFPLERRRHYRSAQARPRIRLLGVAESVVSLERGAHPKRHLLPADLEVSPTVQVMNFTYQPSSPRGVR